jgi:hypothetical protein
MAVTDQQWLEWLSAMRQLLGEIERNNALLLAATKRRSEALDRAWRALMAAAEDMGGVLAEGSADVDALAQTFTGVHQNVLRLEALVEGFQQSAQQRQVLDAAQLEEAQVLVGKIKAITAAAAGDVESPGPAPTPTP